MQISLQISVQNLGSVLQLYVTLQNFRLSSKIFRYVNDTIVI